jgi:hypothetical protein
MRRFRTEAPLPEDAQDLVRGIRIPAVWIALGEEPQASVEAILQHRSLTPRAMPFDRCSQVVVRGDSSGVGCHPLKEPCGDRADILAHQHEDPTGKLGGRVSRAARDAARSSKTSFPWIQARRRSASLRQRASMNGSSGGPTEA